MRDAGKLAVVKTIHTLIWVIFNLVLIYLFYAAYTDQVGFWFWMGIGLIVAECVVLVINRWSCPLTPIARRYTDSTKDNFDLYIPAWLARNNKLVYSMLVVILIGVYLIRVK